MLHKHPNQKGAFLVPKRRWGMANVKYISYEETVQCIADTANQMLFMLDTTMDKKNLEPISFFAEKFVLDCIDYCHRTDFPRSLVYTGAELAVKYSKDTLNQLQGPLKSLKESHKKLLKSLNR